MTKDSNDNASLSEAEKSRREFIKAAGKLAVYTPPALMLLMRPTPNAIANSTGSGITAFEGREDHQSDLVTEESEQDQSQ
jgi:hypothetical protein